MARMKYIMINDDVKNFGNIGELGIKKALKKVGKAVKQVAKAALPVVAPALPMAGKLLKKPFSMKTGKLKDIVKQELEKGKEKIKEAMNEGNIQQAQQIQQQVEEANKVVQELTNMEKAGTNIVSASKQEEIINRVPSAQKNINMLPKTTTVVYKLSSGKWVYKSNLQPNLYIEIPSDLVIEETTPQDFVEKQVPINLAGIDYGIDVIYDELGGLNLNGLDTGDSTTTKIVKILATITGTGTADLEQVKAIETRKIKEIKQRTIIKYLPIGLVCGGLVVYLLLSKKSSHGGS